MANKYGELLQLTNLLGRQLINLLAEADTVDTNRLKPVAKAYQEFADNVQAVAMAAEVYK